jgi:hypothetical protein
VAERQRWLVLSWGFGLLWAWAWLGLSFLWWASYRRETCGFEAAVVPWSWLGLTGAIIATIGQTWPYRYVLLYRAVSLIATLSLLAGVVYPSFLVAWLTAVFLTKETKLDGIEGYLVGAVAVPLAILQDKMPWRYPFGLDEGIVRFFLALVASWVVCGLPRLTWSARRRMRQEWRQPSINAPDR